MLRFLYLIWFCLVAFPVMLTMTILTAVATIVFFWCPNSAFIVGLQRLWSKMFFWFLFCPVTVEGEENLKPNTSYVFVCNHQSMLDVWVIYGYLPVIFKWIMKKEVGRIPLVGTACRYAGHICIDRSNPRSAYKSLEQMRATLKDGICTVIFPEGTRTKTGKMGAFKRGAFQIALDAGLEVVPLTISGAWEAWKPTARFATPHPIRLSIGKPMPMTLDRTKEPAELRADEEAFIAKVHEAVASKL